MRTSDSLKYNPLSAPIGKKPTFLVTPKQFDKVSETITKLIDSRLNQIQPQEGKTPEEDVDSLYAHFFGTGVNSVILICFVVPGLASILSL